MLKIGIMLTDSEKKKRQHQKELKSLRNKMNGYNLIWFDSLSDKKKWDLLFEWKFHKYHNDLKKPDVTFVNKWLFGKRRKVKQINYPANLKHFLKERMGRGKYSVRVSEVRNSVIDILLNNKK